MTQKEMGEMILRVVDRSGDPTMVEIMNALGPEGQAGLDWMLLPNVVLWSGMSDLAIDAFASIRSLIEPRSAHVLCYAFDGQMLRLPLAKRPTKKGYQEPRWLPVRFVRRVPTPTDKGRERSQKIRPPFANYTRRKSDAN